MSRRDAPATHRNRAAILTVLTRWLTGPARVLEIASGSGQHAVFFAAQLPHLSWQPSDRDPDALASIESWETERPIWRLLVMIAAALLVAELLVWGRPKRSLFRPASSRPKAGS